MSPSAIVSAAILVIVCRTVAANDKPNFIWMMADDLGWGDVGYNGGVASTPHLDEMASGQNSILLHRYYSGGPVCSPTRGTVLTGRNHNRYCVWTANAGKGCADFKCPENKPLPLSEITVAEVLNQTGYATGLFGKWHLGDFIPLIDGKWNQSHPGQHGFQSWWATERSAPTSTLNCACFDKTLCVHGHYPTDPPCTNYYTYNDTLHSYPSAVNGEDAHFILSQFEDFLKRSISEEKPFFAYLPFHNVHVRFIAYEGYIEQYTAQGFDLTHTDYYGAISALDDVVGQVRKLLHAYNVSDNTLLWFSSDNGPQSCFPGSASFLKGCKGQLTEGGIRVPGIIEWPAKIKHNLNSSFPVVSSDFFPTVCDILGVQCPRDRPIDGKSILPFLKGKVTVRNSDIAWAYNIHDDFDGEYNAALSGDQYKLIAAYKNGKVESSELYDLLHDPSESVDLSGDGKYDKLLSEMKVQLEKWRQSVINSAVHEVDCMQK